jgi:hypothetical protein
VAHAQLREGAVGARAAKKTFSLKVIAKKEAASDDNSICIHARRFVVRPSQARATQGERAAYHCTVKMEATAGFKPTASQVTVNVRTAGNQGQFVTAEPGSARERLRWLKRQAGGYVPHIYYQLALMYSSKGQDTDARRVKLADQR